MIKYLEIPKICPVCEQPLSIITSDSNVEVLYCTNVQCQGKLINRLNHFCGKNGLDIKGLSKATLEKLVDWGWVNNIIDIMILKKHKKEWVKKPGFGTRSVENILNNIENAKNTSLEKFISSLGIPLIGNSVSKDLVKYIDSYEDFRQKIKEKFNFSIIEGFAENKTKALLDYDYSEADEVYSYLQINNKKDSQKTNNLNNIIVVITGKLNKFKNRTALQKEIENSGGKVVGSISSKTNYLINNDKMSTSAKNISAKRFNIPILSEEEFIEKFLK